LEFQAASVTERLIVKSLSAATSAHGALLDNFTIWESPTATNRPPSISPIATRRIDEEKQFSFRIAATDPDVPAQTLTYTLEGRTPAGTSINPVTGEFSWIPSEAQGPSTNIVSVRVTDNGTLPTSTTTNFTVIVNEVNLPPILAAIADQNVLAGSSVVVQVTATDADIPIHVLTFSLGVGAPIGASIDASTGLFSWTPTMAQGPSTNRVTVRVTDNGVPPLSATTTFTIVVQTTNRPPVFQPIKLQRINEEEPLALVISASDPDLPPQSLTYGLEAGTPLGVSIERLSGRLTWTPSEAQGPSTNVITVRVTDDGSPALSATNKFEVIVNEVNRAPVLAVIPDQMVTAGETLRFQAGATDPDLPDNTLIFSLEPGAPSGASVDPKSGLFTWTPTTTQEGRSYTITVRVTDNGSPAFSDARTFTITVPGPVAVNLPEGDILIVRNFAAAEITNLVSYLV